MKYGQLILGVLIGAVGMHLLHKRGYMSNNPKKTAEEVVVDVKEEEKAKYAAPIKKKFDIVMPSDLVSKKVRQKAKALTQGRYEVDLNKVKDPVSI